MSGRRGAQRIASLLSHLRGFQTGTGAFQAIPSGGGASPGQASFPAWLANGGKRIATPLTEPLPGVNPNAPYRASLAPPPTEITVLENGVRIVTEASPVSTN